MSHDSFEDALAAYAIDALDPGDRRAFETHLASCGRCQHDLAELRRVAAGLGLSGDPVAPPASLRARTLAAAVAQPQRPAVPGGAAAIGRPRAVSIARLATAAGFLLAATLGAYALSLRAQLDDLRQVVSDMSSHTEQLRDQLAALRLRSERLIRTVEVASAPDVVKIDLRGAEGAPAAAGRAFVSRARGIVLDVSRLPALPAGKIYQLWVLPPRPGPLPASAGVFTVDAAGTSNISVPMPASAPGFGGLAVSVEPAGGSPQPTTPPLLVGTPSQ